MASFGNIKRCQFDNFILLHRWLEQYELASIVGLNNICEAQMEKGMQILNFVSVVGCISMVYIKSGHLSFKSIKQNEEKLLIIFLD